MANTLQAKKRARQAEKRRLHNTTLRSRMRSSIKNVLKAITTKDKGAATTAYRTATSLIDSTTGKGMQHKNKASRLKSRLNARLRALA